MSKKTTKVNKPVSKKTNKSAAQVAAQAEPVAVVTTAAPAAEATAAANTVAPAAKPAKLPKAPRVPRVEQNGIKRPKAGGACERVWAHLDAYGDMSVADVKAWAVSEGLSPGNAACEIYLWRKFSGVKVVKPLKTEKAANGVHTPAA